MNHQFFSIKQITIFIFCLFCYWQNLYAADLLQVFQQALQYDPSLLQAKYSRLATLENTAIQRAPLLPNISANTQYNRGNNNLVLLASGQAFTTYSLSITQVVFDYGKWLSLQQTSLDNKAANATYNASLQDLIQRVVKAYFDVLQAQDSLQLTLFSMQQDAKLLAQTRLFLQAGLKQPADVYTAQANYDADMNNVISAQKNVTDKIAALHAFTGIYYNHLTKLKNNIPLLNPQPNNLQCWLQYVRDHNRTVIADHYTALSARKSISIQVTGHFPTLSANADYSYSPNSGTINPTTGAPINGKSSSANLSLSFPIFSGGSVIAQTHQAQYKYYGAIYKMRQDLETWLTTAQQSFWGVVNDIKKIQADILTINSNIRNLHSVQLSYKAGTKQILDILNAQQSLIKARQILINDKYDLIENSITLKQAAGTLSLSDLQAIEQWLVNDKHTQAN